MLSDLIWAVATNGMKVKEYNRIIGGRLLMILAEVIVSPLYLLVEPLIIGAKIYWCFKNKEKKMKVYGCCTK